MEAMKEEMQEALRTDSPVYGRVFAPMVMAGSADNCGCSRH